MSAASYSSKTSDYLPMLFLEFTLMLKHICSTYLHVYLVIFLSIVSFLMKDFKTPGNEKCVLAPLTQG